MSPWKCSTSHVHLVYRGMTHTPPYTMLTAANKQAIKRGTIEPCLRRRKGRKEVRGRSATVVSRGRGRGEREEKGGNSRKILIAFPSL